MSVKVQQDDENHRQVPPDKKALSVWRTVAWVAAQTTPQQCSRCVKASLPGSVHSLLSRHLQLVCVTTCCQRPQAAKACCCQPGTQLAANGGQLPHCALAVLPQPAGNTCTQEKHAPREKHSSSGMGSRIHPETPHAIVSGSVSLYVHQSCTASAKASCVMSLTTYLALRERVSSSERPAEAKLPRSA